MSTVEQQEKELFSAKSTQPFFSRYKLLLLLTNCKILELEYKNPVHFAELRQDTMVLTAARTAGAVAVCKVTNIKQNMCTTVHHRFDR